MKKFWVYILASKKNGTLYVGITSNLISRIYNHKKKIVDGFSKKYNVTKLVYVEEFLDATEAIQREKRIKKWDREWKLTLIEEMNPNWKDLSENIV